MVSKTAHRILWGLTDTEYIRIIASFTLDTVAVVDPDCISIFESHQFSSVQFSSSVVSNSLQPHGLQHPRLPCPSPTLGACSNLCPSSQWCHPTIWFCHPLLLLPSIFPGIRVFSNESALRIRWPKYWSFSFSISPSSEYSGLISFRTDWFDLLAVQGTLKSLLQHHSSKASILRCSAFFIVQLSHPWDTGNVLGRLIKCCQCWVEKRLCVWSLWQNSAL